MVVQRFDACRHAIPQARQGVGAGYRGSVTRMQGRLQYSSPLVGVAGLPCCLRHSQYPFHTGTNSRHSRRNSE